MLIHQRTHPNLDVPGCFACRISNVSIAASALGSVQAQEINARERRWDRDIDAYRRLRRNGVQPRCIDGSAMREARANTVEQVEH